MPKISVIVPVYKAEAYLHRCVDSLLAQTFQDFEVLLVDDGSPDRSGAICDEYARRDSRVRVFHKENGGVSSARQCGLDNAHGDYTIHADPDDWVEPDMLEALYAKATAEDADMVICDFYVEQNGTQTYCRQEPSALDHETVLRELFQQLHGSCCNKLVKRACYNAFGVRFPQGIDIWEDRFVNACLLIHNIRVAYLNQAFYHYVIGKNANSIVHRRKSKEVEEQIKFITYFEKRLLTVGNFNQELTLLKASTKERAFMTPSMDIDAILNVFPEIDQHYYRRQKKLISPFMICFLITRTRIGRKVALKTGRKLYPWICKAATLIRRSV